MIEINPVLKTYENKIIAVDTKVVRDENALYRHPDYAAMRYIDEEETAGLMDMIKLSGLSHANFLYVGGTVDAHRVEKAVCILLKDKGIRAANKIIEGGIRLQGTNAKEASVGTLKLKKY